MVSVCGKGHGLFVTHATLREVKATGGGAGGFAARALDPVAAPSAASPSENNATIPCPRCRETMSHRKIVRDDGTAITLDVCGDHGTWFDAGELRAVLDQRTKAATTTDAERLAKQSKATLDVALALEASREESTFRKGVDVAEDILDLVFDVPPRRRRWY